MRTCFAHKTPGTNLTWYTLEGWVRSAHQLDQRRSSSARHKALDAHACALTRRIINAATNLETIDAALSLLKWAQQASDGRKKATERTLRKQRSSRT